jgi:putative FmdB family regulatory protein
MPIYEYVCNDCGYDFEQVQSFSDDALRQCPECQGTVRRVISSVGVIFKGSGWYITDSRRQLSGSTGTARGRSASDDKAAGDKKPGAGDGKPEAKTVSAPTAGEDARPSKADAPEAAS